MKRVLLTALLAIAVVAAGMGVNEWQEGRAATAQIPTTVEFGEDSRVHPVTVHLHGARPVGALAGSGGETLDTAGLWVVLDLSYATDERETFVSSMLLVDDQGRQFEVSGRTPTGLWLAEPGLWQRGEIAFEVPTDALGEMTLEIYIESRWLQAPVRFGRAQVYLDPGDVEPGPVELARAELLPGGRR
ncbi:hypothetical protein ACO0LV_03580 [Pseudactinotalea sp. Z1739]|uniref:hypothetical protein n=1 Tax=Pseudactinotalea sp. Z1739 TaxID=3413028 RepID=UPI003C7DE450